ncbi:hypothetical protein FEO87_11075 [Stenotrophomonas maltophilia]|nr:hypothetical protein FEO87_11075 [Stenotrophomonas maltophilia]
MRLAWLLLCMPCAASAAPLLRSEGVATLANGVIAYREVHWQRGAGDGSERWVEYLCPAGQPFARKQMPAATRPQMRGYVLQDARSGQAADVRVDPGVVRVDWKEDTSTPSRTKQLPLPPDAVIDAGFDAAVRAHWRTLQGGAPVSLPFLVPGRQRFYPVQVQYQGPVRWQGLSAHAVNVRLDTWFGAVAPRLSLVYADADRRLLEFRGTSNLRDVRGDYPQVTVRFAAPATEQPEQRWRTELQRPLVASCGVTTR